MSNSTALVTGASDGIGLEFCKQLAQRNYNLILVARNQKKLQAVADQLTQDYSVECRVIPCDLSEPQAAQRLYQAVQDKALNVDLLINNAGLLYNGYFVDLELEAQERMMMVNMVALTSLSHLFANAMLQRDGGRILNLASTAGWQPIPNQNVYAATKAYVLSFSQALVDEMDARGGGVSVTALCPGYTATRMLDNPEQGNRLEVPASMILPAEEVARQGIDACLERKPTHIPGGLNRVLAYIIQILPKMTVSRMMGKSYRKQMGC